MFVAADVPDAVRSEAGRLKRILAPRIPEARWTLLSNLHVTLAFLGETSSADAIAQAMRTVAAASAAPDVRLDGAGAFPSERRARIVWIGLAGDGSLATIAGRVAAALHPLGFEPEDRPFSAHLTIARLRTPRPVDLSGIVVASESFRPPGIALYRSHLGGSAPRYELLDLAPFPVSFPGPVGR